jgi:predicted DNA-binding protein
MGNFQDARYYIEPDMMEALRKLSKKKGVDVSTIVNEWIKKDISIVETVTK